MFRLVILYDNKTTFGKNFKTKGEAETFLLEESEKCIIKRADIKDLDTGERKKVF